MSKGLEAVVRRDMEAEQEVEHLRTQGIVYRPDNALLERCRGWSLDEILDVLASGLVWVRRRARDEDRVADLEALLGKFARPGASEWSPVPASSESARSIVTRATRDDQSRLHEAAHAVVAELLDVPVSVIVTFGEHGAEMRHEATDPHRTALIALASLAIGDIGAWGDYLGPSMDLAVARAAADELDPDDAAGMYERLRTESRALVVANVDAVVRLAGVLERFGGRLAGWQLDDGLAYALQRPTPPPTPGPRFARDRGVLRQFMVDRRHWQSHLVEQLEDPTDEEAQRQAFVQADRRALEQEPPPRPERRNASSDPPPAIGTGLVASSEVGPGSQAPGAGVEAGSEGSDR